MLKIEKLCYSVIENGEEKVILQDINLEFEKHKIYVITGPNGSGKSTLLKNIMGILTQKSGHIFWNDEDISSLSIDERAKKGMSYAFQKPVTFKGLKIGELLNIASGKNNNVGNNCDYLSFVGLCAKDYISRPLDDNLSGGEQKRIELAMLLAKGGEINIFDEPEAGIDLWSFENLTKIFTSLKDSINIIVSHQSKILELADTVIMLKSGKIDRIGKYDEVKNYLFQEKCNRLR